MVRESEKKVKKKKSKKWKTPLLISSSCLRYYKVTDPAGWVNVDVNTGELKVANTIDREATHVVQGLYDITIKAVDASKLRCNPACPFVGLQPSAV